MFSETLSPRFFVNLITEILWNSPRNLNVSALRLEYEAPNLFRPSAMTSGVRLRTIHYGAIVRTCNVIMNRRRIYRRRPHNSYYVLCRFHVGRREHDRSMSVAHLTTNARCYNGITWSNNPFPVRVRRRWCDVTVTIISEHCGEDDMCRGARARYYIVPNRCFINDNNSNTNGFCGRQKSIDARIGHPSTVRGGLGVR